jgi:hypothetical protein
MLELEKMLSASRAVELGRETAKDLAYLLGKGTSLGGMRPKCSILDEDGLLALGKFPSIKDERSVTRAEVLALKLASLAGVNAAHAHVAVVQGNLPEKFSGAAVTCRVFSLGVVPKYTLLNEAGSTAHGLTGVMSMSEEEAAKLALFEGRQIRKPCFLQAFCPLAPAPSRHHAQSPDKSRPPPYPGTEPPPAQPLRQAHGTHARYPLPGHALARRTAP